MESKTEITSEQSPAGATAVKKTSTGPTPEEQRESAEVKSMTRAWYWGYYLLGIIEVLLVFRFIFKILGANPNSGIVSFTYSLSDFFMAPFVGIFNMTTAQGNVTTAVFEPGTLVAMVVYAVIAWGITKIVEIMLIGKGQN